MNVGYSQDNSAAHAICVNNEKIKTVQSLNLLGVTIDSKLNFTDHITSICTEEGKSKDRRYHETRKLNSNKG